MPPPRPRRFPLAPQRIALLVFLIAGPAPAQLATGPARILAPGLGGLPGPAQEFAHFGASLAFGDFDCDGFDDLAIGAFDESEPTGPVVAAGAVYLVYGSAQGLSSRIARIFEDDLEHAEALAEPVDRFGLTLAVGNFDGDSAGGRPCEDLVIGAPQEDDGSIADAGAVWVVHGAPGGLDLSRVQHWSQSTSGIAESSEQGDGFGRALASGDFDGDGFDDLAIGAPFETRNGDQDAGTVWALRGSASGLTSPSPPNSPWRQLIHQDIPEVLDEAGPSDQFGQALTACDIDADGRDDLVVGVPGEDLLALDAGAIHVFFGAANGLDLTGQALEQATDGSGENDEEDWAGARLGSSLAFGELLNEPGCELLVGSPQFSGFGVVFSGLVTFHKPVRGAQVSALFGLFPAFVPGEDPQPSDLFGTTIVVSEREGIEGEGGEQIVVGAPGRGGFDDLGRLFSFVGDRFSAAGPADFLPEGHPLEEAALGSSLAAGDTNGDGISEIAAGLPDYPAEEGHPLGLPVRSGMVLVIETMLFGDGFESGALHAWSSASP